MWCGSDKNVDLAHVDRTEIEGRNSRGMNARYLDVICNPDAYRPMCRKHHRLFDRLVPVERPQLSEEPIPF